jgi:plastocyanin
MTNTPTQERPAPEESTPASASAEAPVAASEEPTPFWHKPYVERFLLPLVVPIVVVFLLVMYILNISRLLLAAHGHIPILVGSAILLAILVGATILSAVSPRLSQSTLTLTTVGFILLVMASGWLVLGHSQPEETGPTTLADTLKTTQTVKLVAAPGGKFSFAPDQLPVKTGLAMIEVTAGAPGHNFSLRGADTLFKPLELGAGGTVSKGVAFFSKAGPYVFFCAIPGHEAAGMKGDFAVTGPPMTLAEALKDSGNPASAGE